MAVWDPVQPEPSLHSSSWNLQNVLPAKSNTVRDWGCPNDHPSDRGLRRKRQVGERRFLLRRLKRRWWCSSGGGCTFRSRTRFVGSRSAHCIPEKKHLKYLEKVKNLLYQLLYQLRVIAQLVDKHHLIDIREVLSIQQSFGSQQVNIIGTTAFHVILKFGRYTFWIKDFKLLKFNL